MRGHGRVPDGPRLGRLLLHRGEPARPGRAYRDRGGHRHRHRPGADPDRRGHDARRGDRQGRARPTITLNGHAIQCRITTEDPQNNFIPDYGRITAYRGADRPRHPARRRHRLFGRGHHAATTTRCWRRSPPGRRRRRWRSRGSTGRCASSASAASRPTSPSSRTCSSTRRSSTIPTRRSSSTRRPSSSTSRPRRDRATKILTYVADITVNGHPETAGRAEAAGRGAAAEAAGGPAGRRRRRARGSSSRRRAPKAVADWMLAQKQLLVTDTTMRDGHQSLLATRMRSYDMIRGGAGLCRTCCRSSSASNAGAARPSTSPTASCRNARGSGCATCARAMPNLMTQMLLRASNGVGYTNYPDNVVRDLRRAGGEVGRRRLPRVRLAELGREHARRDGRGDRHRQDLRGGDLLHRRPPRPGALEVRPEVLRRAWPRSCATPARTSSASRTWPGS